MTRADHSVPDVGETGKLGTSRHLFALQITDLTTWAYQLSSVNYQRFGATHDIALCSAAARLLTISNIEEDGVIDSESAKWDAAISVRVGDSTLSKGREQGDVQVGQVAQGSWTIYVSGHSRASRDFCMSGTLISSLDGD
jgi:hypothetical protein